MNNHASTSLAKTGRIIGANITFLIKRSGVSIHQISKHTGISSPTIKRIITGEDGNPTLHSLEAIANYFNITLATLIGTSLEEHAQLPRSLQRTAWTLVPLIAHEEVLYWPQNKAAILNNALTKSVSTDSEISDDAYAMTAIGSSMEPAIPEKATLIVDPQGAQCNLCFVVVVRKDAELPQIKQLLLDGPDKYLKTFHTNQHAMILLKPDMYKIVGVVKEIILKL